MLTSSRYGALLRVHVPSAIAIAIAIADAVAAAAAAAAATAAAAAAANSLSERHTCIGRWAAGGGDQGARQEPGGWGALGRHAAQAAGHGGGRAGGWQPAELVLALGALGVRSR